MPNTLYLQAYMEALMHVAETKYEDHSGRRVIIRHKHLPGKGREVFTHVRKYKRLFITESNKCRRILPLSMLYLNFINII